MYKNLFKSTGPLDVESRRLLEKVGFKLTEMKKL